MLGPGFDSWGLITESGRRARGGADTFTALHCTVSVLGRDEGYTVKYTPLPEGVPWGKARWNF